MSAVVLPATSEVQRLTSATEMANRQLSVQGEILKGLGSKVQDWGKNTQWAGRQMMVGMTVPFAMGAAAAGMYANKIDSAMVRVEKVVNEPLEGFREKALDTAKEITHSVGQTVESTLGVMSELAAAGLNGQALQDMTKLSQVLATLGDMDQQSSIKGMISIQQIYKMSTKELSDAVNYLNYVEDQTPTKLQDLVDAIPIAGTQVAQLGGTLQDTTVLLSAFRERGIETVEGANAIKTAMNRILVPTKQAKNIFKELTGKDLEGLVKATGGKPLETFQALSDVVMGGNVALEDQQRIISKLVGTYQSSRITALLAGLQDKTGAVSETRRISEESTAAWAARTAQSLKAITDSASGQFKISMESFKAEFMQTGEVILRIATWIVQGATKVFTLFNNMPEFVKWIALVGLGLVALAGPITMIVGIFANFIGTLIKIRAFVTGASSKYKSMSIDQKVLELTTGNLNTSLLSQADAVQVLIYQMDKLKAAYQEVNGQAIAAATNPVAKTPANANFPQPVFPGSRGYVHNPTTGEWRTNTGKAVTDDEKKWLDAQAAQAKLNSEKEKTVKIEADAAAEVEKTSRFQKVFNSETLITVGVVTGLLGLVTDTGSGFSSWLNYISLGAVALGTILPVVSKVKDKFAEMAAAKALSGTASKIGETAKGFGSKLLAGGKAAFSKLGAFVTGPWGIGIGATIAGIWGIVKLLNAGHEEQLRHQQAIVDSTNSWMKVLGKAKIEWGQIRDESGKVKDNINSIVDKMRKEMPDLVSEVSNATGSNLDRVLAGEVMKLEGQGLNRTEILDNMRALLMAAGKTKKEIESELNHIKVSFDFVGGKKDLDLFIKATKSDLQKNISTWVFEMPVDPNGRYGDRGAERSEQQDVAAEKMRGLFMDRLAGMSDTEKAIFANKFAAEINSTFDQTFQKLDDKYKGDIAKNWKEAKSKFFNWDTDDNKWQVDKDAQHKAGITDDEIHSMEIMIDTEQRLTQAIARGLHISEDRAKKMSVIGDILPYIVQGEVKATDAQEAYNNAVKQAKDGGKELTEEEKKKLAQLIATTFGLNAATIQNNGYAKSQMQVVGSIDASKRAMQDFINDIHGFSPIIEDFWDSMAVPQGGFADALGGDALSQAKTLTESVKGIYNGTMNDIYGAMAAQAEEQWQARMDAITESFENRREAIQKQVTALDKSWDQRMQDSSDAYDARKKSIEDESETQIEAIDAQIKIEQDREDARQRQFDAEKRRIERITELANRNIDYNRALATGNLDEAARVMNNTESLTVGWSVDDSKEKSSLLSKDQVDQLSATKELIQKQKDAKLEALSAEEEATRRSMEAQKDIEKERLQNKLDSLSTEQQAAETTERHKQEMNKRTLDIELATLKTFIPKNEQELAEHVARISSAYGNYGINLQTAGGYWGTIIGNALTNNVNRARQEMSNNAAWAAFGSSVAGAISQGAFGLSLSDFFTLIATGAPPAGWTPPGVSMEGKSIARPGGRLFYHTGGMVGTNGMSTQGRPGRGNSPLGGDEVPTILQAGEFVFPKSAVQLYGSEYLQKLSEGAPTVQQDNTAGIGGMFGSLMGAMGHSIIGIAMNNLMTYAASLYGGGGGTGSAVEFAKAQDGKPYVWGSAGPNGYDCSGYMSAIANVLTGQDNPYKRLFATGSVKAGVPFGPFEPGSGGPFQIGVKHGNPGHTAGTLMGIGVESTGNHVRYGKDASLATDKQFTMQFHIPDDKIAAGAAIPGLGFVGGEPGSDAVQQRVKAIASRYGWAAGAEWVALYNLIQGESSWNPSAANPSSTARGLFQKLTSVNGPIESTIEGQTEWGLNYIKGRYGDPINAYAKWMSRSPHWYDTGGDVQPGPHMIYNGTNQVESMITHSRTSQLIDALDVANITYKSLGGIVKSLTPSIKNNAPAGTGDVYHANFGDIIVNGTNLTENQLKKAVQEGVETARIKRLKRTGGVK